MNEIIKGIINDCFKIGLCFLATFATCYTFPTTSSSSTSSAYSCYQLGVGGGSNIAEQIKSLASRTDEMRSQAEGIKSYMKATFNWVKPQTDYLNKQHFINITELTSADENGIQTEGNDVDWAEQLKKHYKLLDLLLRYISNIESSGTVNDMGLVDSTVDTLLEISNINCTVLTALAKVEADYATIMEEPYSVVEGFFNFQVNLDHIRYRAYIVMNDYQMLMQYLNQVYQSY